MINLNKRQLVLGLLLEKKIKEQNSKLESPVALFQYTVYLDSTTESDIQWVWSGAGTSMAFKCPTLILICIQS